MSGLRWALLLAPVGLLVLSGCGQQKTRDDKLAETMAEKVLEHATGKKTDVSIKDGKVKIANEGMEAELRTTADWPPEMPPSVPRFAFGHIERVTRTTEGEIQKLNVFLGDVEGPDIDRYDALLRANGWTTQITHMGDQGAMLNGQREKLGLNLVHGGEKKDAFLAVYTTTD
jgi:hypothetical protein